MSVHISRLHQMGEGPVLQEEIALAARLSLSRAVSSTLALACIAALVASDVVRRLHPKAGGRLGVVARLHRNHLLLGLGMVGLKLAPMVLLAVGWPNWVPAGN
jgi:hypothetical protein